MAFKKFSGIFIPTELELLQQAFDELCKERHLALEDRDQREWLASEVMEAFQSGLSDATELRQALSKRSTAPG